MATHYSREKIQTCHRLNAKSCRGCLCRAFLENNLDYERYVTSCEGGFRGKNEQRRIWRKRYLDRIKKDPIKLREYLEKAKYFTKRWKEKNPDYKPKIDLERKRELAKKYRAKNQHNPAYKKQAYLKVKATRKRYPEKYRAMDAADKHRRQAAGGIFTGAQWLQMKALYGYRCVYCGKKSQRLTMDHVIPLSQGGLHTWENIVPACRSCNSKKHTKKAPLHQPVLPFYADES